jgi:hypothetical protein
MFLIYFFSLLLLCMISWTTVTQEKRKIDTKLRFSSSRKNIRTIWHQEKYTIPPWRKRSHIMTVSFHYVLNGKEDAVKTSCWVTITYYLVKHTQKNDDFVQIAVQILQFTHSLWIHKLYSPVKHKQCIHLSLHGTMMFTFQATMTISTRAKLALFYSSSPSSFEFWYFCKYI